MSELSEVTTSVARSAKIWGIAVLIMGILAIAMPFVTGVAITISIGAILLVTGIAQFIFAFQSHSFGSGILRFAFGLMAAMCGISLISQPAAGLATITLFLAVWFFVDGLFAIFTGISRRPDNGWGLIAFNGFVGLILGIMIYRQFPVSATWLVGLLVGIRLIMAGWMMIALGAIGKQVSKEIKGTGN
jgi:uncharacterized membrane protein HdeD (DUF308 family)